MKFTGWAVDKILPVPQKARANTVSESLCIVSSSSKSVMWRTNGGVGGVGSRPADYFIDTINKLDFIDPTDDEDTESLPLAVGSWFHPVAWSFICTQDSGRNQREILKGPEEQS